MLIFFSVNQINRFCVLVIDNFPLQALIHGGFPLIAHIKIISTLCNIIANYKSTVVHNQYNSTYWKLILNLNIVSG